MTALSMGMPDFEQGGSFSAHPYIEVSDVFKGYGSGGGYQQVLKGVSTDIEQGKICVIMGKSGSGKSTLLNAIGGLEEIDEGSIRVGDIDVSALSPDELSDYRRDMLGFIFQFYNLVPNLSVRENIAVCQYLSKDPLDIDELIDVLGLRQHAHKFPSQLSGGQQQRCAIARALVKNPAVLLCDEPTGALDSKTSREILALLEEVNRAYGTTMIMVTHDDGIKDMADRVIIIADGLIAEEYENENPLSANQIG